jgi:hypothetical protein
VEAYEISEYAAPLDAAARRRLFPFVPAPRQPMEDPIAELRHHLASAQGVEPAVRARLEQSLVEAEGLLAESRQAKQRQEAHGQASLVERLRESARHFEEEHPNLSGLVGSVIDALGRMGI